MSFPKYPKYKPSGVEWLGDVPEHWRRTRIKHAARNGGKTFIDGDWIESPYITTEGVRLLQCGNVGTGVFEEQGFRFVSEDTFRDLDCTEVEPNDVLICRLQSSRTILAGRACLAPRLGVKMITSVDNCILKPSPDFDSRYIVYQLTTPGYLSFIEVVARGGTRDRISRSMLGDIEVAAPPIAEQTAIAAFLDRETGKIDELVAEQRRLMELLKEKRQAVISHAVTKGLNPHAPTKPSGIEWLGDVPEHWQVRRLKFLCDIQTGDKDTENAVDDGLYPFFVRSQTVEQINSMAFDCEAVLTAGDGVGVGKVFHYHNGPFNFHQRVYMMNRFRQVSGPFLFHFLRENFYKVALEGGAKSTVDSLRRPVFMNFPVCVPPDDEQGEVVKVVESESTKFDTLTAEAQRGIELLQERRTALISAAVTGKIDVRGLASGVLQ